MRSETNTFLYGARLYYTKCRKHSMSNVCYAGTLLWFCFLGEQDFASVLGYHHGKRILGQHLLIGKDSDSDGELVRYQIDWRRSRAKSACRNLRRVRWLSRAVLRLIGIEQIRT